MIALVGVPPFVVTLGTLSVARSLAMVLSNNKMVYQFGPDHELLLDLGGGSTFGIPHPVYALAHPGRADRASPIAGRNWAVTFSRSAAMSTRQY